MLRSMTGFGAGRARVEQEEVSVELKSLNHKFSEVKVRLPRELRPIAQRLTATLDLLKRAFAREKQATADISHELRSPLARLNVALGLVRQRSGFESANMLDRIELEVSRLNELIGRLLTLARIEDGQQSVPRILVPLDELVLNVAEDAEFEAQARHCHVRSVIPPGEWRLRGEASLLHSAVENVVRNAIRYTGEGTTVQILLVRAETPGGAEAVVKVTDCGPGVPPDTLEKLFQPFYRLDDARGRQTGGVGLGLAITERAVRFHGGRVAASNRAEGGLEVELRLPLVAATPAPAEMVRPVTAGRTD